MRDMNLKKTLIQYIDILKHKKSEWGLLLSVHYIQVNT